MTCPNAAHIPERDRFRAVSDTPVRHALFIQGFYFMA